MNVAAYELRSNHFVDGSAIENANDPARAIFGMFTDSSLDLVVAEHAALQLRAGPYLDCEEIRGDNLIPMSIQELLPCRLSTALGSGLDPVPLQDIGDGVAGKHVAHVSQSALDSPVTPAAVFLGHTKN